MKQEANWLETIKALLPLISALLAPLIGFLVWRWQEKRRRTLEAEDLYEDACSLLNRALSMFDEAEMDVPTKQELLEEAIAGFKKALNRGLPKRKEKLFFEFQESGSFYEVSIRKDAAAHFKLAEALTEVGRIREANMNYSKAIQIEPRFAQAFYRRGMNYYIYGELDEAQRNFQAVLKICPNHEDAIFWQKKVKEELRKMEEIRNEQFS